MALKIAVIVGSTRSSRSGLHVAQWFQQQVKQVGGAQFDLIDLKKEDLPFLDEPGLPSMGDYQLESTKNWAKKIDGYDGYVFVTPEYNHGYAATLKNAIDTLYAEWQKKPVAFVGYGVLGGARAIEQLVPVVSQIGMVPLPYVAINIVEAYAAIDEYGKIDPTRIKGSKPERLVGELVWWANTLKSAREQEA